MSRKSVLDPAAMGLMVLLCALWGLQQVAVKVAGQAIPPLLQGGLRSGGSALLLVLWSAWRRQPLLPTRRSLVPGLAVGLLFALEFALLFRGLSYTTASRAVVFLYTAPFIVAAGTHWLVPGEALGRWQLAGLACAFAGVVGAFADNLSLPEGRQWLGDLLCLGAALAWGATTVGIRASALASVSAGRTLFAQLAVSAVVLPLLSLATGESPVHGATPLVWAALAYQIVIVAFASYLAWFWLMTRYAAARLSAFSFLTPLFGMLFGSLLLGEPITPLLAGAMLLVAIGLLMVNRPSRPAREQAADPGEDGMGLASPSAKGP